MWHIISGSNTHWHIHLPLFRHSHNLPQDDFYLNWLPLFRVQEHAWNVGTVRLGVYTHCNCKRIYHSGGWQAVFCIWEAKSTACELGL